MTEALEAAFAFARPARVAQGSARACIERACGWTAMGGLVGGALVMAAYGWRWREVLGAAGWLLLGSRVVGFAGATGASCGAALGVGLALHQRRRSRGGALPAIGAGALVAARATVLAVA